MKSGKALDGQQAFAKFVEEHNECWSAGLKLLLEEKHLYQKVEIRIEHVLKSARDDVSPSYESQLLQRIGVFLKQRLYPTTDAGTQLDGSPVLNAFLLVPNVKLYCRKCKSAEVYTSVYASEVSNELSKPRGPSSKVGRTLSAYYQVFFLALQCQRCQGDPECFLVRRRDQGLVFEGRSPFEHIELPSYIPEAERSLFRDAVISHQAGKTLAGLFYLRTFLEQYARRQTGVSDRISGDELLERYGKLLPASIREEIPSLRLWYERLSTAIHQASADGDLFVSAEEEIDRHFDMRRLFKLPDCTPEKVSSGSQNNGRA